MKINITPMITCIDRMRSNSNTTEPQMVALDRIAKIVHHAQNTAYARPPQPVFSYGEPIFSALAKELSEEQVKMLDDVNIQLAKTSGMFDHEVKLTFQS